MLNISVKLMTTAQQLLYVHHTHTHTLHFNGHFPGEPGLAGVFWSKGWWRWWRQLEL